MPKSPTLCHGPSLGECGWTDPLGLVFRLGEGERLVADAADKVARMVRGMRGGNGIMAEYGLVGHAQNLETMSTCEGTHDNHALIPGHAQIGLQAFA